MAVRLLLAGAVLAVVAVDIALAVVLVLALFNIIDFTVTTR